MHWDDGSLDNAKKRQADRIRNKKNLLRHLCSTHSICFTSTAPRFTTTVPVSPEQPWSPLQFKPEAATQTTQGTSQAPSFPGTWPHLSSHPKESHAARPTSLCEEEDQEASPSYRAASRKFFVQYNHFASSSYAISILLFQSQLFRLYLKLLIHFVTDSLKTQISWSLCDKQLSEMYLFYKLWEKINWILY